jgi:hypothetical protein
MKVGRGNKTVVKSFNDEERKKESGIIIIIISTTEKFTV